MKAELERHESVYWETRNRISAFSLLLYYRQVTTEHLDAIDFFAKNMISY